jgi:hypothetical protein
VCVCVFVCVCVCVCLHDDYRVFEIKNTSANTGSELAHAMPKHNIRPDSILLPQLTQSTSYRKDRWLSKLSRFQKGAEQVHGIACMGRPHSTRSRCEMTPKARHFSIVKESEQNLCSFRFPRLKCGDVSTLSRCDGHPKPRCPLLGLPALPDVGVAAPPPAVLPPPPWHNTSPSTRWADSP